MIEETDWTPSLQPLRNNQAPTKPENYVVKGRIKVKPIKMLVLAAMAALMAMAFLGASSAMAENTALCATDEEPCAAIMHVHETSVGKAKLVTSSGTIECDVLFLSTTGGVGGSGAPQVVKGNFTYSNCTTGCTVTEENGPVEITTLKEGHETGSVTGKGLVHSECSFLNCRYVGTGLKGTAKGPLLSTQANGEVSLKEQSTTKESGTFCPTTSKLTITTTPLEPTYIAGGLHYCVKYEHLTGGLYNDSGCTERSTELTKTFELVVAPSGFAVGEVLCVKVHAGLWKTRTGGICSEDAATLTGGIFEKGTITAIKN